jgi:hypothetical protein
MLYLPFKKKNCMITSKIKEVMALSIRSKVGEPLTKKVEFTT